MDLENVPPGYRFCPFDWELVIHYLEKKVKNEALPPNRIMEVDLYKFTPDQLQVMHIDRTETEMYFFTKRDRKYLNGSRPNRVTDPGGHGSPSGHWKATAADNKVMYGGKVVGFKKTLVFYRRTYHGDRKVEKKTNWIMHEFRVADNNNNNPTPTPTPTTIDDDGTTHMKMDWVICRIHENVRRNQQDNHSILLLNNEEDSIIDPTTTTTMAMDLDSENPRVEDMVAIVAGEESQPYYYAGNSYDYVAAYPEYMQQPPPLEYMQQPPPPPQNNDVVEIPQLDNYYDYYYYTNNNNSTEYGNNNPTPQNNDFGGYYYYTGELVLADSIQSACPSQSQTTTTEALESMANREEGTPNWNMLPTTRTTPPAASQDYADDSIMPHHTLQNNNNNTTVDDAIIDDDAEFQSFLEDALSFLPPLSQPWMD